MLIKPLNVVVGGLGFTAILSPSFFVSYPPSSLNRTQPKPATMFGSECNLKMHVKSLGYSFPVKIGGPKTPILDIFDNFTSYRQI